MKIKYINNDGRGFADFIEVAEGLTAGQLFADQMSGERPENYKIRVNREEAARGQVLQEGDRVSFVALKVEGAA